MPACYTPSRHGVRPKNPYNSDKRQQASQWIKSTWERKREDST